MNIFNIWIWLRMNITSFNAISLLKLLKGPFLLGLAVIPIWKETNDLLFFLFCVCFLFFSPFHVLIFTPFLQLMKSKYVVNFLTNYFFMMYICNNIDMFLYFTAILKVCVLKIFDQWGNHLLNCFCIFDKWYFVFVWFF